MTKYKTIESFRNLPKLKEHVQLQLDVAIEDYFEGDLAAFEKLKEWFMCLSDEDKLLVWTYLGKCARSDDLSEEQQRNLTSTFNAQFSESVLKIFLEHFEKH